ncbi:MAG: CRISPR-associated helicase Cas3' [Candidatus Omnitrophota bacterium]
MIPEYLWAKKTNDGELWHPLVLHLIDVAAVAEKILSREPASTRSMFANAFNLSWHEAKPLILFLVACHDIGKASPGFQLKWKEKRTVLENLGIKLPKLPDISINHAFITQLAIERFLKELGWSENLAMYCADAVGCHHGARATSTVLNDLEGNRHGVDDRNWSPIWQNIFKSLCTLFAIKNVPSKSTLSGAEFMLLAGLTSFADWIGSNEEWFPFGNIDHCDDLSGWFKKSQEKAKRALDSIGWENRSPLAIEYRNFTEIFPECVPPRPLQETVVKAMSETKTPGVFLIEAPMGEGKTEAAFYAYMELQRQFGHRGMYMALPTKATGNAMFKRVLKFLRFFSSRRTLDLQLIHGASQLNDAFQKLRINQICSDDGGGGICASEWFTHKKRALLSEYGVGTIDQALVTILPVRHYFVRLWGLANRVVIFDEIHAYDAYTGTLLFHCVRWLRALGASVILLSATLSPEFRRRLAEALGTTLPKQEEAYPRLTVFTGDECKQIGFTTEGSRCQTIAIEPIDSVLTTIEICLREKKSENIFTGVVVNTVQRAQELYTLLGDGDIIEVDANIVGKRLPDGTEVNLFHARYPAGERQRREDYVLSVYGKNQGNGGQLKKRNGQHILIATQVVEQSLDLDFDFLISDLAPIDLILQRAGRLWRHQRKERPFLHPILCVAGVAGDSVGSFGSPLWWNKVYREDILLRTWSVLKAHGSKIVLPNEIDSLVRNVYDDFVMPTDKEMVEKLEKAEIDGEGNCFAQRSMAHRAVIGLPDDGSWKDANRFYLYDEDEPGVHHTLKAMTRLGEDSVTAIPLFLSDNYDPLIEPDFAIAKQWSIRSISLSRLWVIKKLRSKGVPAGWKKQPLLRNYYPMLFDNNGNWTENDMVKLDRELGILYKMKEG